MFAEIRTKRDQAIAIELLRMARRDIRSRCHYAVCGAVATAAYNDVKLPNKFSAVHSYEASEIAGEIKQEIAKRIGGQFEYVTDWLKRQGIHNVNRTQARIYRMRWIGSMINEIKQLKVQ